MFWIIAIVFVCVAVPILILIMSVDDWSRDLTHNTASTDDHANDVRLRPIECALPPQECAERVAQAVGRLPRWAFAGRESDKEGVVLHFVRTTRVGFNDDIHVQIQ